MFRVLGFIARTTHATGSSAIFADARSASTTGALFKGHSVAPLHALRVAATAVWEPRRVDSAKGCAAAKRSNGGLEYWSITSY